MERFGKIHHFNSLENSLHFDKGPFASSQTVSCSSHYQRLNPHQISLNHIWNHHFFLVFLWFSLHAFQGTFFRWLQAIPTTRPCAPKTGPPELPRDGTGMEGWIPVVELMKLEAIVQVECLDHLSSPKSWWNLVDISWYIHLEWHFSDSRIFGDAFWMEFVNWNFSDSNKSGDLDGI